MESYPNRWTEHRQWKDTSEIFAPVCPQSGSSDAREVKASVPCMTIFVLNSQGGYQNFLGACKAQGA